MLDPDPPVVAEVATNLTFPAVEALHGLVTVAVGQGVCDSDAAAEVGFDGSVFDVDVADKLAGVLLIVVEFCDDAADGGVGEEEDGEDVAWDGEKHDERR